MRNSIIRKGMLGAILFFLGFTLAAQDVNNYTQVKSSGNLPEEITKLTQDKVKADINTLDDRSGRSRQTKEQYILESNYLIDELMSSGKVLVNDPLSNYVNKVADKLLESDPDLRSQIKIYVVKSPVVNAFTFDKGIIFVNVGLLAQLENEAQLAFILSHEITHFSKRHAINAYVEYDRIDRTGYRRGSYEDRITQKSTYSKELETEADLEGLQMYLKTNYSIKAVIGAFDVLQYSYLPFEEIEFDKSFLETNNLVLPDEYFLKETAPIKGDDNYDDSKSTHPNIRTRRTAITKKLEDVEEGERKKYLVSEEEFKKIREVSRFEICRLYLIHRDYPEAIYSAYILLKKYPDNLYLQKIVSKALFSMAAYKNKGRIRYGNKLVTVNSDYDLDDYDGTTRFRLPKYEDIEGNSQQVYHVLHKLNRDEMSVVALAYAWKVRQKAPDDPMIKAITDSLFAQLVFANNLHPSDFSKKTKEEIKQEQGSEEKNDKEAEHEEDSKYAKIKQKQVRTEVETSQNFIKYAFIDYFKDKEFTERYNYFSDKADKMKESRKSYDNMTDAEIRAQDKKLEKERKELRKKGLSLGIDKIVIVDPYYNKIDKRKKNSVKYFASETSQQAFTKTLTADADKLGLQYELLDPNSFNTGDVDKFNDYSVINDWVTERFNHEDNAFPIVCNTDEVQDLVKKYGTKYFMWTGVVSVTEPRENAALVTILSIASIYGAPFGIYYAATPQHSTLYYSIVFDVETGQVMMFDINTINQKDTQDLLNSNIYDTLLQIKKKDNTRGQATTRK